MIRTSVFRLITAVFLLSGWTGLPAGSAAAQSSHTHQHSFGDAERWAQVFDDPQRDAWRNRERYFRKLRDSLRRTGYALAQEHTFLPNQYFLVFRPTGS